MLLLLLACNQPPNAPIVAITPEAPSTQDDLVAVIQGEATDPDADGVTYTYAWFVDGAPTEHTGATVPASATTRGETWKVVVTPTDGKAEGALGQAEATVLDTAPTVSLALDPLTPGTGQAVTVSAVPEDADGDEVRVTWAWTRDGADVGLLEPTIPADTIARGEVWAVTATPSDGELDGEPATLSFTVANAAPTLDAATIAPEGATVTDALVASFDGVDDADGDAVVLRVRWMVDGVEVADEEIDAGSTSTLAGLYAKHQEVVVEVTPWDGYDEGAPVTSEALVVADAPPSLTGATISPDPVYVDSVVTCAGVGWSDADGDAEGWRTEWTLDGVVVSTEATLPAGTYARGDTIGCTLLPDDGELTGAAVTAPPVVVSNSPPACTDAAVVIGPDPATQADPLAVSEDGYAGCADADGDAIVQVYDWRVGGVSVATTATLAPGLYARGDEVVLETGWSDGLEAGAVVTSNTLVIANAAPEILSLALSPSSADTSTVLSAAVATFDEEGDTVSLTYAWTVDGVAAGTGATLDGATAFSRGQTVALTVTPSDGIDAGTSASASLVVGNAAPSAPTVRILPSAPDTDDPLVCSITAAGSDPDGDAVSYTFAWAVGGVAWSGATTTTFPGDTVPASVTTNGQTWTCTVSVTDGTDAGTPGTDDALVGCDADGDGYDATSCGGADCDDTRSSIHPGASEVCDSADTDEDCDGLADDADDSLSGTTYYPDADGDSFGDETAGVAACSRPTGYVSNGDDCDDTRASVKPGGYEVCDSADLDEDCDGLSDNDDPSVSSTSYRWRDADGDGYGDASTGTAVCSESGWVSNDDDCEDTDAAISPAATEVCADGVDNDCDASSIPCGIEGTGTLSEAGTIISQSGTGSFGRPLGTGDFDGDGDSDLVVADATNEYVRVYYGPIAAGTRAETDDDVTVNGTAVSGFAYSVNGVGDVDGDGDDDIVALSTSSSGGAYLIEGGAMVDHAAGTAELFDTYYNYSTRAAAAGDVDGDGYGDISVGGEYYYPDRRYRYHLYLGDVSGTFTEVTWDARLSTGELGADATGGEDLDGDGLADVVIDADSGSYGYSGVYALMGDAAPAGTTIATTDRWFVADSSVTHVTPCMPGDVDLDGYPDLGVYVSTNTFYIFQGPPTTGLTTASAYASSSESAAAYCAHGSDTNGDGADELVFGVYALYRYDLPLPAGAMGDADGDIPHSSTYGAVLAPGELTGDGYDDLLVGTDGAVYLFPGGEW